MGSPILDEFEVKILALGGSGAMGQVAVRTILEGQYVDQLIIADYDLDRAKQFVESLNDERVSARFVDVQNSRALEELMSEVDIVMNTVGPFYRFGEAIIRAAIKAERNCVDIMDDYGPTQKVLELDEEARRAGVTILIGMGASPGITNILARHAADQLDEVEYIQTAWGHVGGVLRPTSAIHRKSKRVAEHRVDAAFDHFLYNASFKAPLFRDGQFVEVVPLEDGEDVTFPSGKGFFHYFGHPEPVTLPRFIDKGIRGACNLVGLEPEELDVVRELAAKVRAGELSPVQAAERYPQDVFARKQERREVVDSGPRVGGLHASASGKKSGKMVRYGYGCLGEPPKGMGGSTGVPLAIGVELILEGKIEQQGVVAPEACIDPLLFFERYMKYWVNPPERVEQALYEVVEEL